MSMATSVIWVKNIFLIVFLFVINDPNNKLLNKGIYAWCIIQLIYTVFTQTYDTLKFNGIMQEIAKAEGDQNDLDDDEILSG